MTRDEIDAILACIEDNASGMSKWEEDFVASVREQFDEGRSVSHRQIEILERIQNERI